MFRVCPFKSYRRFLWSLMANYRFWPLWGVLDRKLRHRSIGRTWFPLSVQWTFLVQHAQCERCRPFWLLIILIIVECRFRRQGIFVTGNSVTNQTSKHGVLFVFLRRFLSLFNPFEVICAVSLIVNGGIPIFAVRKRSRPKMTMPIHPLNLFR